MASRQKNRSEPVSELRRDLVTGNWIVIAKARGERPHVAKRAKEDLEDPIVTCPFEDPQDSGNEKPVLIYKDKNNKDWSLQVIPNKYPAFSGGKCNVITKIGPYSVRDGKGFHEVIITRDHSKHLALLPPDKIKEVFSAYKERYLALKDMECVKYISIFHNHGKRAGASLTHPHSQLIAIPISPPSASRSLSGAAMFYKKHSKCVHCTMLDWEREDKKRIVSENSDFIAICPFISRGAYEIRIFPQKHSAHFQKINESELAALAKIFQDVLIRLYEKLQNPDYNFYLHTAPIDDREYPQYHWHFEIHPKTETSAGFELGTGVEISAVEPERAAEVLRM